jgi:O-antigen ligase
MDLNKTICHPKIAAARRARWFFMNRSLDRFWAFAVLFMNGWHYALPVTDKPLPIWLTSVQIISGVYIYELLLVAYLVFQMVLHVGHLPLAGGGFAKVVALQILVLALLGIVSCAVNVRPYIELVGAMRYILLALYFLLVVNWAMGHGASFVLRSLLLGIACSGAFNIFYSFMIRREEVGGLPLLLGQNGPGGYLGLSVILSAWLMLERRGRLDVAVSIFSCVVGSFAASISYSKLSMLMATAGLLSWLTIYCRTLVYPKSRKWGAVVLVLFLSLVGANQQLVGEFLYGVELLINAKFRGALENTYTLESRAHYWPITAEIVAKHPLSGVGYGGFFDAATATEAFKSGSSNDEGAEGDARRAANPHNSLLYSASAYGIPGALLVVMLLGTVFRVFWYPLSRWGWTGKVLWGALVVGYLIYANTLPTLFNTPVLYLPAAFAIALTSRKFIGEVSLA